MNGNIDKAKGRAKQVVGDLTGNDELKKQGEADETVGSVKDFLQEAEDKSEEVLDKANKAIQEH